MTEPRATIEDVARFAGVSRGTVSRVLNDSPRVSDAARTAVQQAVAATGYRANPHARSLASGRSNTVAVLLTRPHAQLFEDPTFSLLLQGISDGLIGTDLGLALLLAGTPDEQRRAARFIDPSHIDGVIHLSPLLDDPMVAVVARAGIPGVVCGHLTPEHRGERLWSVTTTDRQGAHDATRHLLEQDARRVALIAGPRNTPGSLRRFDGFRDAMGDAFDPDLVEYGDYGRESGSLAMEYLLDRRPDLDAVFCASDRMALGAMEKLRSRGLTVPDDVLVAGFDDHEIAATHRPGLTSVHQPIRQIGRTAVQVLVAALAGDEHDPPQDRLLPTRLEVRDSTRRP